MSAHTSPTPPDRSGKGSFRARRAIAGLVLIVLALILVACQAGTAALPSSTPASTASTSVPPLTAAPATAAPSTATPTAAPATAVPPTEQPSASAAAFPVELVGYDGETVVIDSRPERIISLTPATTETLFALGAGDRVVGKMEDIANFPPEAANVPVVGSFLGVDIEQIVDLEPDLVIAGGNGGTPQEAIDQLRQLGQPTLTVYAADVEEVLSDIELIGQATGDSEAAADLTADMRADFEAVAAATADVERPRVFYETGDQPALYGVASDSFVAAMIELAGGEPITTGSPTVWEMPVEELIEADPEVIVLGDAAGGVTADAVAARPGWSDLTAVRNEQIYPIDDIIVTRPGPRLAEGLAALLAVIHPEIDLDA